MVVHRPSNQPAPKRFPPNLVTTGLSLLLITGGVWVAPIVLHPPIAQAYKSRVDVQLDRLRDETYQSFIRRAEIIARSAAQRSFDRDILAGDVSIMVIGRHNGTETPVLLLEVSRDKWRERPDTRTWAIYYRTAQTLLKLPNNGFSPIPNAASPNGVPNVPQAIPEVAPVNVPPNAPITVPAPDVPVPVPSPSAGVPPQPGAPTPAATPITAPPAPGNPTPAATPIAVPQKPPAPAKSRRARSTTPRPAVSPTVSPTPTALPPVKP